MRTLNILNFVGKLLEGSVSKMKGYKVTFYRWEKTLLQKKPWDAENNELRVGVLPVFTTAQVNLNRGDVDGDNNGMACFAPGLAQIVIISEELVKLGDDAGIQAVIYHECGHISHGDLIKGYMAKTSGKSWNRDIGREISADLFAAITMSRFPEFKDNDVSDAVIDYLLNDYKREIDSYEEYVGGRIRRGEDAEDSFRFFWPTYEETFVCFESAYRLNAVLKELGRSSEVTAMRMTDRERLYYDRLLSRRYVSFREITDARKDAVV